MKTAILLILFLSAPKVGDLFTEDTQILIGQVWEGIWDEDDPFKEHTPFTITILDIKDGYYLYRVEARGISAKDSADRFWINASLRNTRLKIAP